MSNPRPYTEWPLEALKEYERQLYDDEKDGEDTWAIREEVLRELDYRYTFLNEK